MEICLCLIESFHVICQACQKQQTGGLPELVDENLKAQVNLEEVDNLVKVAVLCTNVSPLLRPTMSEVVKMLEGEISVPEVIPTNYTEDLRFKAVRDLLRRGRNRNYSGSQSRIHNSLGSLSAFSEEFIEIIPESRR